MANGEAKWQTRGYLSVDQSTVLNLQSALNRLICSLRWQSKPLSPPQFLDSLPERVRGTIISFPLLPEAVGSFSSTAKDVVTSPSTAHRTLPRCIGESCSFRVLRVGVAASGEMIYPSREAHCSGLAEPGIWGHAYEVNEGGSGFWPSITFRGSGPARAIACENAQSADLGRRGVPMGAPDDDESTRDGPLEDRDEIVKTRQTLGAFD
ncbi:hypothetical protein G5I_13495 [Acromyrmex echinatior]|uniref:Uncharacterized protein n=1 Tax=Acromyrmex echinatior TaxID=103372 RepID=F4X570_ACREC|nr:hypothetical protein G5I_13495 [Acromyrmex echinatior]